MVNDLALLDRIAYLQRELLDQQREITDLKRHNQELREAIAALLHNPNAATLGA